MTPKVSVILPTYNRARSLSSAVKSVLTQSYSDFELIVIDDASEDDTELQLEKIGDCRVHYMRHDTNRGAAAARNTGLQVARGRYIAFQDSDDVWLPSYLQRMVDALEAGGSDCGACFSSYLRIKDGRAELIPSEPAGSDKANLLQALLKANFVSTQTLIAKREILAQVGHFDMSLRQFEDWDLAIRIALVSRIVHVAVPLVIVYHTPGSITDHIDSAIEARLAILEKYRSIMGEHKNLVSHHEFVISRQLYGLGRISESCRHAKEAYKGRIFDIKMLFWLILISSRYMAVVLTERIKHAMVG
ncbi:MAG: glycosyltransferase family 2 protein [Formivibrio sp.]|nr:glycosyltransferase family 2 protein [Formivibrio sp.]